MRAPSEPPNTSTQVSSAVRLEARASGDGVKRRQAQPGGPSRRTGRQPGPRSGTRGRPAARGAASSRLVIPRWLSASVSTERDPPRDRREPDRPRDVAAAAEHRRGRNVGKDPASARKTAAAACPHARAASSGFVRLKPGDADRPQLVARGRNERRLRALAADEHDASARGPKPIGDRQRGHDVPGRPPRCDQHARNHRGILAHRPARRAAGARASGGSCCVPRCSAAGPSSRAAR